jgi:hypothetical protein
VGPPEGDVYEHGDAVSGRFGGETGGVIEEHFVRSSLDHQRRQAGEAGEDWTDETIR